MSKLMLAFLGTNDYLSCNYYYPDETQKICNVRFIQEALASLFCKDWTEKDRIVIFLTEDAKSKNWVDDGHKDREGKPMQREGLERRLKSLNLTANVTFVNVPNGKNENEIWEIFDKVVEQINDNDEVIFDITHGFRSLPMLSVIILNYAKVLKNIKINGVYYGAFEFHGTIPKMERKDTEERNAPIFDLTPFVYLFDWIKAVNDFVNYGDAKYISEITMDKVKPILKDTKGQDETAQNLKRLSGNLKDFTSLIQTCRGLYIFQGFNFNRLKELVETNKGSFIKPMNPLLDKISNKISNFHNEDIKNGYSAVQWCIEHNLIQQGYTILQETMITEVIAKYFGNGEITNRKIRELTSQTMNIKYWNVPEENWNEIVKNNKRKVKEIMRDLDNNFAKIYCEVSDPRNDINHSGFRDNPREADALKKELKKRYDELV